MKAISIRIKHTGSGKAGFQRRHDARMGKQPEYVDAGRRHLNSVLIEPATPGVLRALCAERVARQEGRQRALKSDAAIATIGVLTFSREAQKVLEELSPDEQDRRIRESCEAAAAEMGVELTGLVVHRDEQALHAHFQVPARRADGRPISKTVDTRRLQDVAAEAWADLGITRGKPKAERIADGEPYHAWRHRTVKQLHEDLPRELESLEAQRSSLQGQIETAAARAAKARAELDKVAAETEKAAKLRKRLATYERRLGERQAELDALEKKAAGAKKAGGRLGAFFAGVREAITGKTKGLEQKLDQAKEAGRKALERAKERTRELDQERSKSRTVQGQLVAKGQQLEAVRSDLEKYRGAAQGLSPDALSRVVKRGLNTPREIEKDRGLEL